MLHVIVCRSQIGWAVCVEAECVVERGQAAEARAYASRLVTLINATQDGPARLVDLSVEQTADA